MEPKNHLSINKKYFITGLIVGLALGLVIITSLNQHNKITLHLSNQTIITNNGTQVIILEEEKPKIKGQISKWYYFKPSNAELKTPVNISLCGNTIDEKTELIAKTSQVITQPIIQNGNESKCLNITLSKTPIAITLRKTT